jgi:SAM-dependent methyltransferase
LVARRFLAWLAVSPGRRWLDVGCGAGALSQVILDTASPAHVVGVDHSQDLLSFVRSQIRENRVRFELGDACALPFKAHEFDVTVSGLVLNFVGEPSTAVAEMARVVRVGGPVAAYVWDYADGMQMLRHFWDAAAALDPVAHALDEGRRFPLCQPDRLVNLFRASGLRNVEVHAIDVPTSFKDFDDFWAPFLGSQGPAPTYVMALGDERRGALRDYLRSHLPIAPDGSFSLKARAWAACGVTARHRTASAPRGVS